MIFPSIISVSELLESCHTENKCLYWTFNEELLSQNFTCSLLDRCDKHEVPSYPVLTYSGSRHCEIEPYRRIKCTPACKNPRPFCKGRCVYPRSKMARCLFGPCSDNPYFTSGSEDCTDLAFEAEEDICKDSCKVFNVYSTVLQGLGQISATECQNCLENNLPDQCNELSGSECWFCSTQVLLAHTRCSVVDKEATDVLKCVEDDVASVGCTKCICTLICYRTPETPECQACLKEPMAKTFFNNHQICPQTWVWSQKDKRCYKAIKSKKNWTDAATGCTNEKAILTEPGSYSALSAMLESINLNLGKLREEVWIGGRKEEGEDDFQWSHGNSSVEIDTAIVNITSTINTANWALMFPKKGMQKGALVYLVLRRQ